MSAEQPGTLRIGELAEHAGVTRRTIRYYVAEGLLPPPGGSGQQRTYTPGHLARLNAIERLKRSYLPLAEIRRFLAGCADVDLEHLLAEPAQPAAPGTEPGSPLRLPAQLERPLGLHPLPEMLLAGSPRPAVEPPRAAAELDQVEAEPDPSTVWRRIVLAPGVELHYQVTGDRQRYAAVGRLIREAARILGERPPAGPRDRLGF